MTTLINVNNIPQGAGLERPGLFRQNELLARTTEVTADVLTRQRQVIQRYHADRTNELQRLQERAYNARLNAR